jgi:arylsulfatase A-like enzyme
LEAAPTPNLDQLSQHGGYAAAYVGGQRGGYSETPTISAVGYNSLLTGTWVNKHNVKDNSIRHPNYNYWTIFRHFKANYPDKTTAVYSTWLDNRTKLVGESLPETGNLQLDYHFDGFELDTLRFPHDDQSLYIHKIDQMVAEYAARDIDKKGPDLTWVYLQYTDDMGHKFGESPEMHAAIQASDRQVGLIWEAVQRRMQAYDEDWLVVITTDHGRETGGFHHGGQSDEERATWIVSNKKFNEHFNNQPGVVDIFPTIATFMGISIPKNHAMELDGVPLLGEPFAAELQGKLVGKKLTLAWRSYDKGEKALVWVTPGNQFRYGKTDTYQLIGEVSLARETEDFDLEVTYKNLKVVLELPQGFINVWVANDQEE